MCLPTQFPALSKNINQNIYQIRNKETQRLKPFFKEIHNHIPNKACFASMCKAIKIASSLISEGIKKANIIRWGAILIIPGLKAEWCSEGLNHRQGHFYIAQGKVLSRKNVMDLKSRSVCSCCVNFFTSISLQRANPSRAGTIMLPTFKLSE